jgi:hypothetical protein
MTLIPYSEKLNAQFILSLRRQHCEARIQGIEAEYPVSDNRQLYITCEVLLRQFIYLIPTRVVPVIGYGDIFVWL